MDHVTNDATDEWLLGSEAERWLALAADSDLPVDRLAPRLRRELSAAQVHRILEQTELRRRGLSKFLRAAAMFFTGVGLQQATDEWIARYKAQRFVGRSVADLCAGLGGDAIGLAEQASRLLLCDRDSTATVLARHNLGVYADRAKWDASFVVGEVESVDLAEFDAWHIDPDRRPGGRRTTRADEQEPDDATIDQMIAANPNAAIKLAPAGEVPGRWIESGELEWISHGGECKQLVVWKGALASSPDRRRATVLRSFGEAYQVCTSLTGTEREPPAGDAIERYVYEPDPAVLASGLAGELALKHGWWTFANTTGYLTGAAAIDELACARFEVLEVMPLHVKKLARWLRERHIGRLEIKHRAVDLSPERLRKELKLAGDEAAVLLLTRVGEKRIAIVATRQQLTT